MKIRHDSFKTIWYTLRAEKLEKHFTVLKLHFAAKWCRKHSRLKKMNNGRPAHFRDSQVLKWKRRWGSKHSRVFNHSPPNMTHGNCLHALHIIRSSVHLFFCWSLSFLQTLHTSWPSELAPSLPSPSHSFSFLPDAFEPICLKCSSLLGRLVGGPGSLCCCPSLAWWVGYKGRRVSFSLAVILRAQLFFCRFPSFSPLHRPARRLVIAVTPRQRPRFWICRLLSSFRHLARVHKRQYLKRL